MHCQMSQSFKAQPPNTIHVNYRYQGRAATVLCPLNNKKPFILLKFILSQEERKIIRPFQWATFNISHIQVFFSQESCNSNQTQLEAWSPCQMPLNRRWPPKNRLWESNCRKKFPQQAFVTPSPTIKSPQNRTFYYSANADYSVSK